MLDIEVGEQPEAMKPSNQDGAGEYQATPGGIEKLDAREKFDSSVWTIINRDKINELVDFANKVMTILEKQSNLTGKLIDTLNEHERIIDMAKEYLIKGQDNPLPEEVIRAWEKEHQGGMHACRTSDINESFAEPTPTESTERRTQTVPEGTKAQEEIVRQDTCRTCGCISSPGEDCFCEGHAHARPVASKTETTRQARQARLDELVEKTLNGSWLPDNDHDTRSVSKHNARDLLHTFAAELLKGSDE